MKLSSNGPLGRWSSHRAQQVPLNRQPVALRRRGAPATRLIPRSVRADVAEEAIIEVDAAEVVAVTDTEAQAQARVVVVSETADGDVRTSSTSETPSAPTRSVEQPSTTAAQATASQASGSEAPRSELPVLSMGFGGRAPLARPSLFPDVRPELFLSMLGLEDPTTPPFLQALRELGDTTGGPVLYRLPRPETAPERTTLPVMVYLPGIDGTGLAAYRQFAKLHERFELLAVFIPPEDRSSFENLVNSIKIQLEGELSGGDPLRPVYLMGESFGGLVALSLAQKTDSVDRIVLVNPATSFDFSVWPLAGPVLTSLPPPVYNALPILLSPVLTNPLSVALNALPHQHRDAQASSPLDVLSATAWGLVDLVPELGSLRSVLPPATLAHRLQLLQEGSLSVNATLAQVLQRVLLLLAENDLVIPSAEEGPRLTRELPRCRVKVLQGRSHAMLQEAGVDLVSELDSTDFYLSRRHLTSPPVDTRVPRSGATFGRALPVELPTHGDVERALEDSGLGLLQRLVSPVFFSTDPDTGRLVQGLQHVPIGRPGKPVLFVGNHQTLAPDTPLLMAAFLQQRGVLVRGLTHPFVMTTPTQNTTQQQGQEPNQQAADNNPLAGLLRPPWAAESGSRAASRRDRGMSPLGSFLKTFGAVAVSGSNMHKLLSMGETVLVYPGGMREAYKLRGEDYQLIWPDKPEFIRMAAKFGATIVPVSAIGAEDGVHTVLDAQELQSLPIVGDMLKRQSDQLPQARKGVSVSASNVDTFTPPLVAVKPPARFYYAFQKPIETSPELLQDRAACDALYTQVKDSCAAGIQYLLSNRSRDPYVDLVPRLVYEATNGRQAPTFTP